MTEATEPLTRRCARCSRADETVEEIGAVERQSGPAWPVYGCGEHAQILRALTAPVESSACQ